MFKHKARLVPSRTDANPHNPHIEIIRRLLRQIDFDKQYERQEFEHRIKALDAPLKLYFLREGGYLHFSFEGFGDLFGYQLKLSHNSSVISSALINHAGDATLCVVQGFLPNDFRLTISSTPVG